MLLTLFPHVCETSHGKTINLHSIYPHHLQCCTRVIFGLRFVWQAHPYSFCLMVFVFLGPELCRQLPSDPTSRWTPLLLANGWRLHAPITDLHRQVYRHAWRTIKNPPNSRWGDRRIVSFISIVTKDSGLLARVERPALVAGPSALLPWGPF